MPIERWETEGGRVRDSAAHFEVAVVGGGKGGKTLAAKMASAGRSVVMIEKGMIGGSCINVACIPTKTMMKSAKVADLARRAASFGVRAASGGADPIGVRDPTSGALKNAIDFLYAEWNNKAAGFVGYGGAGGARAVEHLRLVMAEVQVTTVRNQVLLSLFTDFENFTTFKPASRQEQSVGGMLDQLIAWGGAMKTSRHTTA